MIRTLVCENVRLLRAGLVALLSRPADIEVVAQLDDSDGIVPAAIVARPDVALIDIDMHGGPLALSVLSDAVPACRILALYSPESRGHGLGPVSAPAHALMPKTASADRVVSAVRGLARGDGLIEPFSVRRPADAIASPLTPRETAVLRVAAEGVSAAEIAKRLNLSPGTVRNYISRAIAKTGTRNRLDAARYADRQGWLLPSVPRSP
ncbi:LuxR C-terminal-related transcriptional regulator [Actinomadura alba]|uniref:Response regulator transcription factor n=1 Tax=Actinomadura alba TaxID=406431 RepID=A0ABR7LI58_9ACTN|nr:response regulator transcription factor [Actinomadura alba]MBC6464454.1 response regulator transcription factor [Actinomadura alba]